SSNTSTSVSCRRCSRAAISSWMRIETRMARSTCESAIGRTETMPEREYEVTIGADGTVNLNIHGHKGKSCLDVVKIFEAIVGPKQSQQLTREFYEPDEQVQYRIDQRH